MSIKKSINIFFSRLWINKSAIFKLACTYTGVVFTFWGFVSLFEPLNGVFQDDASFVCKLLIGILVLLAVFIISAIAVCWKVLHSNEVCLGESSTRNSVYVKYGDMYSPDIVEKGYNGKRAIVVSVNRCFDTIVDDHLVSHNTQHGQVFQELLHGCVLHHYSTNYYRRFKPRLVGEPRPSVIPITSAVSRILSSSV